MVAENAMSGAGQTLTQTKQKERHLDVKTIIVLGESWCKVQYEIPWRNFDILSQTRQSAQQQGQETVLRAMMKIS